MGMHSAAGRPPTPPPEETILPTGERSELDTDALFIPIEDSNFETDNNGQPLAVHRQVPKTGPGSYTGPPALKLGPASKAIVRMQRARRVYRVAFAVVFLALTVACGTAAWYFADLSWGYRNALTYIELRETTPVFAFLSLVMLLLVGLLAVLYWERRK